MAAVASSIAMGFARGAAREAALNFSAAQNEIEADRLDDHSADVARAGTAQMATYSEKVRKFAAASEAAIARKHIDLGSGLASAIRSENERVASLDLLAMQNNISTAILNNQFKASQLRSQAKFDRGTASRAVTQGLITGTLNGIANSTYLKKLSMEAAYNNAFKNNTTPSMSSATLDTRPMDFNRRMS